MSTPGTNRVFFRPDMWWAGALLLLVLAVISPPAMASSLNRGYCWGSNSVSQAGQPQTSQTFLTVPTVLDDGGRNLTSVSPSTDFTCAQDGDGRVWCWGANDKWQVGSNATPGPVLASDARQVLAPDGSELLLTELAVGDKHACGISPSASADSIWCWGDNTHSVGSVRPVPSMLFMARPGVQFAQLSCGSAQTCCFTNSSDPTKPYCWGNCASGLLGQGITADSVDPVRVNTAALTSGADAINAISVGEDHACALDASQRVICWGSNARGQLGNNQTSQWSNILGRLFTRISCGPGYSCAVKKVGPGAGAPEAPGVMCWGTNEAVLNSSQTVPSPKEIPGLANMDIDALVTGRDFACAQTTDGLVYCWGNATDGVLGIGNSSSGVLFPPTLLEGMAFNLRGGLRAAIDGRTVCGVSNPPIPNLSAPFVQPVFNDAQPEFTLQGVTSSGQIEADRSAVFQFVKIEELNSSGAPVNTYSLTHWDVVPGQSAAGGSATVDKVFHSVLNNSVAVDFAFEAYSTARSIPIDEAFSLPLSPAQLKFTLRLSGWPWRSPNNVLRFHVAVRPGIANVTTAPANPKPEVTSLHLTTEAADHRAMVVRLVKFALANASSTGGPAETRVSVKVGANETTSMLSFDIAYFNGSLIYDPDFGLLLQGGDKQGSSSDDNLGLIIGVSVAVPVAVGLVLIVIAAALVVWAIQKRRVRAQDHINFGSENHETDAL